MPLIQNLTMKELSEKTLAKNKENYAYKNACRNAGGINITKCRAYNDPIVCADIETIINIEYRTAPTTTRQSRAGIFGTVYAAGNLCRHTQARREDPTPMFLFYTERTTRDAYAAMLDICEITARNMRAIIQKNKAVIKTDWELTVSTTHDNKTYVAHVQNLLRRKNTADVFTKNGMYVGNTQLNKTQASELLQTARRQYADILTPRKLERLDLLVQEYQGLRPTVKQYQKMLREKKQTMTAKESEMK